MLFLDKLYRFDELTLEDINLGIGILFGVVVFVWILVAIIKIVMKVENNSHPVQRAKAKVIEKQQLPPDTILSINNMWILFELEEGERLKLTAKALNSLVVGDVGMLTWRGNQIISFDRERCVRKAYSDW